MLSLSSSSLGSWVPHCLCCGSLQTPSGRLASPTFMSAPGSLPPPSLGFGKKLLHLKSSRSRVCTQGQSWISGHGSCMVLPHRMCSPARIGGHRAAGGDRQGPDTPGAMELPAPAPATCWSTNCFSLCRTSVPIKQLNLLPKVCHPQHPHPAPF